MTITRDQVRVARERLGWTQTDLAKRVHLRTRSIAQFERGERRLPFFDLDLMQRILDAVGVEFNTDKAGGLGVTLRTSRDEAAMPQLPSKEPYDGSQV